MKGKQTLDIRAKCGPIFEDDDDDDVFLQPNEKLFIHCCTIFLITFRCLASKETIVYSEKLNNFMDSMADVCCLPLVDDRVRDRLLNQSRFQAESFTYYLHIYLISSEGINLIASRRTEDKVFLVAEYTDDSGKVHSLSMQLFQFQRNGPWLAIYDYVSKTMETMFLNLPDSVIDDDKMISLKLIVLKPNASGNLNPCPYTLSCCYNSQSLLVFRLTPSQIHWDGTTKYFNVTGLVPESSRIKLLLKLRWALRPKLSCGGYNLFRQSWKLHHQLITRFFHYRWRKRSYQQSTESINCSGSIDRIAIVDKFLCSQNTSRNFYWDNLTEHSTLLTAQLTNNQFCNCSEWCSIYSFYYSNPIIRFVLGQNQHLFLIPNEYIVPFHFKAVCTFIRMRHFPCSSLLSSIIKLVHQYIRSQLEERAGNNEDAFYRNKGARVLEEGYWQLTKWSNGPGDFKLSKCPVDDHLKANQYFTLVASWLKVSMKNIPDIQLIKKRKHISCGVM